MPRWEATTSFSHGISFSVAPGAFQADLANNSTAVAVFPGRSGVVPPDGLSIEHHGRRIGSRKRPDPGLPLASAFHSW